MTENFENDKKLKNVKEEIINRGESGQKESIPVFLFTHRYKYYLPPLLGLNIG